MGHLIQRQIVELKFASQDEAQHWTPRLSELNRRIVLAELERVFDELSPEQSLRIERLEIDLGRLRQSDLESDLRQALREQVQKALQLHLGRQDLLGKQGQGGEAEPTAIAAENKIEAEVHSSLDADSLTELFAGFLATGQLPWWLTRELAGQLEALYREFWRVAPRSAERLLLQTLVKPLQLERFIEQFSQRSHQLTLLRLVPPISGELLVDLRKLARHLLARQGFGLQSRVISFKLAYGLVADSSPQQLGQPELLARQFLVTLVRVSGIPARRLAEDVDIAVARLALLPTTRAVLAKLLRDQQLFSSRQEFSPKQPESVDNSASEDPQGDLVDSAEGLEVSIENAGMVLLWPHLAEVLRKLELIDTLTDGSSRPKVEAVLLLQQMVTGNPAGAEHLLALNKLLCGIPQRLPVPRRLRRRKQWAQEVENLLGAVIRQWAALKNTSIGGLRTGFLQRDGILREQGDRWLLQVERKAHDILLEQLPWGLGVIRLSWMQKPLMVEW